MRFIVQIFLFTLLVSWTLSSVVNLTPQTTFQKIGLSSGKLFTYKYSVDSGSIIVAQQTNFDVKISLSYDSEPQIKNKVPTKSEAIYNLSTVLKIDLDPISLNGVVFISLYTEGAAIEAMIQITTDTHAVESLKYNLEEEPIRLAFKLSEENSYKSYQIIELSNIIEDKTLLLFNYLDNLKKDGVNQNAEIKYGYANSKEEFKSIDDLLKVASQNLVGVSSKFKVQKGKSDQMLIIISISSIDETSGILFLSYFNEITGDADSTISRKTPTIISIEATKNIAITQVNGENSSIIVALLEDGPKITINSVGLNYQSLLITKSPSLTIKTSSTAKIVIYVLNTATKTYNKINSESNFIGLYPMGKISFEITDQSFDDLSLFIATTTKFSIINVEYFYLFDKDSLTKLSNTSSFEKSYFVKNNYINLIIEITVSDIVNMSALDRLLVLKTPQTDFRSEVNFSLERHTKDTKLVYYFKTNPEKSYVVSIQDANNYTLGRELRYIYINDYEMECDYDCNNIFTDESGIRLLKLQTYENSNTYFTQIYNDYALYVRDFLMTDYRFNFDAKVRSVDGGALFTISKFTRFLDDPRSDVVYYFRIDTSYYDMKTGAIGKYDTPVKISNDIIESLQNRSYLSNDYWINIIARDNISKLVKVYNFRSSSNIDRKYGFSWRIFLICVGALAGLAIIIILVITIRKRLNNQQINQSII